MGARWPWVAPRRHFGSTDGDHGVALDELAGLDVHRCTHSVLAIFCTSVTAALADSPARFRRSSPRRRSGHPTRRRAGCGPGRSPPVPAGRRRRPRRAPGGGPPPERACRRRRCRGCGPRKSSSKPVNTVGPASTSSRNADRSAWACLRAAARRPWRGGAVRPSVPGTRFVDREARLGGHLQGQLDREARRCRAGRTRPRRPAPSCRQPWCPRRHPRTASSRRPGAVERGLSATAMRLMRSKSSTSSG